MGRELRKFPAIAGHQQAWAADLRAEGALFPPGPAPCLGGRGSTGPSDKGCQQIGHPLPQVPKVASLSQALGSHCRIRHFNRHFEGSC